jgi:hypothetical protein
VSNAGRLFGPPSWKVNFYLGDEMFFAFLPWQRLPAYVLGLLSCSLSIFTFVIDEHRTAWHIFYQIALFCFGAGVIWYRYVIGVEPFWTAKQRIEASRKRDSF